MISEMDKEEILRAYKKKALFTVHALNRMNLSERMITKDEVYEIIEVGVVIEEYKDNARGHSCLICGKTEKGRFLHVVCAPKDEYLAIITAYILDPTKWEKDMKTRR
jgi:predicted GNAT family acetyltransferase